MLSTPPPGSSHTRTASSSSSSFFAAAAAAAAAAAGGAAAAASPSPSFFGAVEAAPFCPALRLSASTRALSRASEALDTSSRRKTSRLL